MTARDVSLCNDALILVGGNTINDFDDGSDEAKIVSALYRDTYDSVMTETDWSFNKAQKTLNRSTTDPIHGYGYSWVLPSDFLTLNDVDILDAYEIYEGYLFTDNIGPVNIDYHKRVAEAKLPPHIRQYIKLKLASMFSIPVAEDATKAEEYHKMAEDFGRQARRIDAQQSRKKTKTRYSLTEVRG